MLCLLLRLGRLLPLLEHGLLVGVGPLHEQVLQGQPRERADEGSQQSRGFVGRLLAAPVVAHEDDQPRARRERHAELLEAQLDALGLDPLQGARVERKGRPTQ